MLVYSELDPIRIDPTQPNNRFKIKAHKAIIRIYDLGRAGLGAWKVGALSFSLLTGGKLLPDKTQENEK